jgi:hypothetical protein
MPELRLGNAQLCYESGTTRTHIPPLGVNRSSTSTTKKEATKCGCKVSALSHETLSPCQDHPPRHRSNKDKIQKTDRVFFPSSIAFDTADMELQKLAGENGFLPDS